MAALLVCEYASITLKDWENHCAKRQCLSWVYRTNMGWNKRLLGASYWRKKTKGICFLKQRWHEDAVLCRTTKRTPYSRQPGNVAIILGTWVGPAILTCSMRWTALTKAISICFLPFRNISAHISHPPLLYRESMSHIKVWRRLIVIKGICLMLISTF